MAVDRSGSDHAYAIGSVLAEFIALILGAAACAGAYWAFFGFGKK